MQIQKWANPGSESATTGALPNVASSAFASSADAANPRPAGPSATPAPRRPAPRLRAAGKPRRDLGRAREYERERSRRQAEARREAGQCVRCGIAPAAGGRSSCERCLAKKREAYRIRIPQGQECRAQVRRQIGSGQAQGRPHRQQAAPGDPPRFGGMYRLRTPSARRGRRDLRALPHRATRGGPRTLRRPAVRRVVREMLSPDERRRLPGLTVFSARIRGPFRRTKE